MPELTPQPGEVVASATVSVMPPNFRSLPGFGTLERLSPVEAGYWGHRYGIDALNPYRYALSGWGETVTLIGDLSNVPEWQIHEGRPQLS